MYSTLGPAVYFTLTSQCLVSFTSKVEVGLSSRITTLL